MMKQRVKHSPALCRRTMGKRMKTAFPAGRIKKIMLLDEDVGKIAAAVPVVICTSPRRASTAPRLRD